MSKYETPIEMEDEDGFEIRTNFCEAGFIVACYITSFIVFNAFPCFATFFVLKAVQDFTDLL